MAKKKSKTKKIQKLISSPTIYDTIKERELRISYVAQKNIAGIEGKNLNFLISTFCSYVSYPFLTQVISSVCSSLENNYHLNFNLYVDRPDELLISHNYPIF